MEAVSVYPDIDSYIEPLIRSLHEDYGINVFDPMVVENKADSDLRSLFIGLGHRAATEQGLSADDNAAVQLGFDYLIDHMPEPERMRRY